MKAEKRSHLESPRRTVVRRRLALGDQADRHRPDFIIVGAQKGGTTSLHKYLLQHPQIGGALRKEPHFFSWYFDEGLDWYLAHFPERGEFALAGEASTSYLSDPEVPRRVRAALPTVKLIALLRNPVDRAYSQYQMNVRKGFEPLAFEDAIAAEPERLRAAASRSDTLWRYSSYLTRGHYAEQIEWWLDAFPRDQLLVLSSERFFADPEDGLARAFAFLGLPGWRPEELEIYNSAAYDEMRPETRAELVSYFAPHNRRLAALLDQDFGWDEAGGSSDSETS